MSLALLLALPFIGSVIAALLPSNARNAESTWSAVIAAAALVRVAVMFPQVRDGGVVREQIAWMPSAGLDLTIRVDGFAWMFAMLVTGIGFLVVLYSRYYMSPSDPVPRFFSFLLAFMGAMLGLVTSGNLIQLVFFWELTSLTSFMLIGYWHHRADARRGARMALIVTAAGGLCLFAGVLLLGRIVGSYDLDVVLAAGDAIRAAPAVPPAAGAGAARRVHEERAVPVPLLAAACDGGADAGIGLPALRDDGEGRRVPAGAAVAGARPARDAVVLDRRRRGPLHAAARRVCGDVPARPEGAARVLDDQPSRPYHAAARPEQPARRSRRRLPHDQPRDVQGVAVHGGRHHRPRDRNARHPAAQRTVQGDADHGDARDGRQRGDGRRAAAERLPVEGDVLRRDASTSRRTPWVESALPIVATIAGIFASSIRCGSCIDVFFGPPSADLPRKPHEPPRWMRVPIELLVLACLRRRHLPGADRSGRCSPRRATPSLGGDCRTTSLALWHGFNAPLLMSVLALVGGVALLCVRCGGSSRAGASSRAPLAGRLDGKSHVRARARAV